MKKFKDWYKEVSGKEFPSAAVHNGNWFMEHGLPLVVSCTCCESTLLLPGAYLDDEDYIYCPSCAGGMNERRRYYESNWHCSPH